MDPFTITVGALGITESAISSIVQLHNFINDVAQAEEVLQDVALNLEGIQRPLNALEALSISDGRTSHAAKEDLKKTGVVEAVNNCGQACDNFSESLRKWTKHSGSAKLSLRDRLSVGVWNKEKIRTFKTQVQSCQAIVQLAVTSTQLIVQLRADKQSETDHQYLKQQLQTLETKIREHLDFTKQQQGENQKRKEELQEEPEDEEDDGAQRALAIGEVKEQSHLLEADQISSGVVFSQVHSKLTGQEIGNVTTADHSWAMVGLPESVVGKIKQRIGDVKTENYSFSAVGVFNNDIVTRHS